MRSIKEGKHAVVIGASMGGLLAARVLSDHFERVTVLDRNELPDRSECRRGVPHGRHGHALLAGGLKVVEELFPGFTANAVELGGVPADTANDGFWFMEGGFLKKTPMEDGSIITSRPFLEAHIRKHVSNIPGMKIKGGVGVTGLQIEAGRVTGIQTDRRSLNADLVVDASGRGSQMPKWLELAGFRRPGEEKIEVQLSYTTRVFKRQSGDIAGDRFLVIPPTPEGKRGGVALAIEDHRWIITLFGHFGEAAPSDLQGYLDFAKSLASPGLWRLASNAEPIGDACTFKFPASTRRRYEKLKRFPDGLLVFGDAICSFNPIYAQGMTVVAQQAAALQKALQAGTRGLPSRFFKLAAKVIDAPWGIAVGGDLRMVETVGPRSRFVDFVNWYLAKLHKLAHSDELATRTFIRVAQLLDPPTAIFAPRVAYRVLRNTLSTNIARAINLRTGGFSVYGRGASGQDKRQIDIV